MNVNEEAFLQKITVAMYVFTSNKMKNDVNRKCEASYTLNKIFVGLWLEV